VFRIRPIVDTNTNNLPSVGRYVRRAIASIGIVITLVAYEIG